MITRKEINLNTPLTEAQIEMLNTLAATPAVPDEDCPELTLEQLAKFKRISEANRESRCSIIKSWWTTISRSTTGV